MEVSWTSRFPRQHRSCPTPAPQPRTQSLLPESTTWWSTGGLYYIYRIYFVFHRVHAIFDCLSVLLTCAQLRSVSWPSLWPDWGSAPGPAACSEEWLIETVDTGDLHYGKHWKEWIGSRFLKYFISSVLKLYFYMYTKTVISWCNCSSCLYWPWWDPVLMLFRYKRWGTNSTILIWWKNAF